jgi:hypothetical protein
VRLSAVLESGECFQKTSRFWEEPRSSSKWCHLRCSFWAQLQFSIFFLFSLTKAVCRAPFCGRYFHQCEHLQCKNRPFCRSGSASDARPKPIRPKQRVDRRLERVPQSPFPRCPSSAHQVTSHICQLLRLCGSTPRFSPNRCRYLSLPFEALYKRHAGTYYSTTR